MGEEKTDTSQATPFCIHVLGAILKKKKPIRVWSKIGDDN